MSFFSYQSCPLKGGLSGAAGAGMAEILAEAYDDLAEVYGTSYESGMSKEEYDTLVNTKIAIRNDIVKLITVATTALVDLDPNIAFYTANNALTYNFMSNVSGVSGRVTTT